MKKFLLTLVLALASSAFGVTCPSGSVVTPNLSLCEPPHGTANWDQYYNLNWDAIDAHAAAGAVWGGITGTLSNQTDLQTALNAKATSATTLSGYGITDGVSTSRTINGKALSGNITLGLASADFANQGTTSTVLIGNAAGNPSFGSVTSAMVDSSIALTSGTLAQFASTTSAQLFGIISDETGGAGVLVGSASPTFTGTASFGSIALGAANTILFSTRVGIAAPATGVINLSQTNFTSSLTRLDLGCNTTSCPAFAVTTTAISVVLGDGTAGGTFAAVLTGSTGLPISTGVSGLGTGVATFLATPSSANLASALTDETGTSLAVFNTSPLLVTPKITEIKDGNGNVFLLSTATASAVDSLTITNAAAANPATVALTTSGTDSNINLNLVSKGTGIVKVNGTAATVTIASGTSALATGAITSATCATVVTTTATGTATTDDIIADFNADPTAVTGYTPSASGMLTIIKYPTTNNVNFKVCNNTSGSITPGAITLNWRVVR